MQQSSICQSKLSWRYLIFKEELCPRLQGIDLITGDVGTSATLNVPAVNVAVYTLTVSPSQCLLLNSCEINFL